MSQSLALPLFLLLQQNFDSLPDPRVQRTRLHRLSDILLLSLAACCAGADSFEDIEDFSRAYGTDALRMLFGVRLDNGVPHHDTFRRVLARLEPKGLEQSLHTLRTRLPKPDDLPIATGKHIALDGKELRGSYNAQNQTSALSLLSVFATDLNLVIGHKKVDSKTNEIPVAQEVLANLTISGATVTADALHCQIETAKAIRQRKAHYLLAVKENQKSLYQALLSVFACNKQEPCLPMTSFRQVEKGHGRLEVRVGYRIAVADWLPPQDSLRVWPDWVSILCIESERRWTHRGHAKQSQFARYFISSSAGTVEQLMDFARSHWKIENNLHWLMDVTFAEDGSRVRCGHEAQNLATLRRLASFLLKATEPEERQGMSIRKRRKWAGWRPDYLLKVLAN
jgi:predicted transposase YbfD/YdcC